VATHGPTVNTLPASWYREEGFFELEKRAIFSKRWMCVSHSLRFREVGEFVNFEIAGYKFFVIRDRQKELKAFLNVCRHRAYPVIDKGSGEGGKVSILSCKYHGELRPLRIQIYERADFHVRAGLMVCLETLLKRLASRPWTTSIRPSTLYTRSTSS
jgi:hypothetical protein